MPYCSETDLTFLNWKSIVLIIFSVLTHFYCILDKAIFQFDSANCSLSSGKYVLSSCTSLWNQFSLRLKLFKKSAKLMVTNSNPQKYKWLLLLKEVDMDLFKKIIPSLCNVWNIWVLTLSGAFTICNIELSPH